MDTVKIVIGLAFLGIGVYFFFRMVSLTRLALLTRSWSVTTGRVESSDCKAESSAESTYYRPAIRYSYRVGETSYEGARLHVGDDLLMTGRGASQKTVNRFFPGMEVNVYFDPINPGDAVLERGLRPRLLLYLLFAVAFAATGAATLLVFP